MAEEFKIALGIDLKQGSLEAIKSQLDSLTQNKQTIKLALNTSEFDSKIKNIKDSLKELKDIKAFNISGKSVSSITNTFNTLSKTIEQIQNSIGTLDKTSGLKNLLTSINEINNSLNSSIAEFKNLSSTMSSFKGINFDIKLGGSNNPIDQQRKYGQSARETIAILKQEASAMESVFSRVTGIKEGFSAVFKALSGTDILSKNKIDVFDLSGNMNNQKASLASQMDSWKQYINIMKQVADVRGIDLSKATNGFEKEANDLITNTNKVVDGEKNLEDSTNKLKAIFGSGLDAEKLTGQLDTIIGKLTELSVSITTLSTNNGLQQVSVDFESLSNSLNTLMSNLGVVRTSISGLASSASQSGNSVASAIGQIANINLSATEKQINNVKVAMNKFGFDDSSIKTVTQDLENMGIEISNIATKYKDNSIKLTITGIDELGRAVTSIKEVEQVENKINITDLGTNIFQDFETSADRAKQKIKEVKKAYEELMSIQKGIGSTELEISKLKGSGGNAQQIKEYEAELKELKDTYNALKNTSQEDLSAEQLKGLGQVTSDAGNKLKQLEAKIQDTKTKLAKGISLKIDNGKFSNDMSKINTDMSKITNKGTELQQKFSSLNAAYTKLTTAANNYKKSSNSQNTEALINAQDKYKNALEKTQNAISETLRKQKLLQESAKSLQESKDLKLGKQKFSSEIDLWVKNNSKSLSLFKKRVDEIKDKISSADKASLGNLQSEFKTLTNEAKTVDVDAKIQEIKAKLAEGIVLKIDNGKFSNDMSKINTDMSKITTTSNELRGNLGSLDTAYTKLTTAANNYKNSSNSQNTEALINAQDEYKNALEKTQNAIAETSRQQKSLQESASLDLGKQKFSSEIDLWVKNNSKALSIFGQRIDEIKSKISSADKVSLGNLQSEFKTLTNEAKTAGVATQNFGDKLKTSVGKLASWFTGWQLLSYGMQGLRSIYDNVLEVDTAMTELYRVTDLTSQEYDNLYSKMTESAKNYGETLDGIINSTASWVRLGFAPDEANRLAEITAMYQHVTDLDEETANTNLITAYKGFQEQLLAMTGGDAPAAVERIADIYDKLGRQNCP